MSSVNISLTTDNAALKASLRGIVALHASGYAKAKNQIGAYMTAQIALRFEQQKLWDGSAMKQSKAASGRDVHWKRDNSKKGYVKGALRSSGKTLLDTGHLRNSYNYAVNDKGVELFAGGAAGAYAASMHFGRPAWTVRAKHKKALHFGGHFAKSANIPELKGRPVLGVNEQNLEHIGGLLIQAITASVARRGI
jgi:Phage virion morphogenesis family